jgi:hypothetical protein
MPLASNTIPLTEARMAQHKVDLSRSGPAMKGKSTTGSGGAEHNEAGVTGAEHKVPLSEAVLRQVGLFGGHQPAPKGAEKGAKPTVRDLRDQEGALHEPRPTSAGACTDLRDVVRFLEAKYKGYFERTPVTGPEGESLVTVRLTYGPAAEVVSGSGATTKAAVTSLAKKLDETFDCLGG